MFGDYCNCTEERRDQEIDHDCPTCGGIGESTFSPDYPCSECGYSGIAKEPSFWCNTCEREIEDPNVFGDDDGEEEEEEV